MRLPYSAKGGGFPTVLFVSCLFLMVNPDWIYHLGMIPFSTLKLKEWKNEQKSDIDFRHCGSDLVQLLFGHCSKIGSEGG